MYVSVCANREGGVQPHDAVPLQFAVGISADPSK
jgi:hypothetical protein